MPVGKVRYAIDIHSKKKFGVTSLLVVGQDCRRKKRTRGRALPAEKLLECTTTYMQQQIQQNVGKI